MTNFNIFFTLFIIVFFIIIPVVLFIIDRIEGDKARCEICKHASLWKRSSTSLMSCSYSFNFRTRDKNDVCLHFEDKE